MCWCQRRLGLQTKSRGWCWCWRITSQNLWSLRQAKVGQVEEARFCPLGEAEERGEVGKVAAVGSNDFTRMPALERGDGSLTPQESLVAAVGAPQDNSKSGEGTPGLREQQCKDLVLQEIA